MRGSGCGSRAREYRHPVARPTPAGMTTGRTPSTRRHKGSPSIEIAGYTLQRAPKSHCPACTAAVFLLLSRGLSSRQRLPWFYLCAACGLVAQVGRGVLAGPEPGRHPSTTASS